MAADPHHMSSQGSTPKLRSCYVKSGVDTQVEILLCPCRWNESMAQGPLRKEHWRKSAQWSSLTRKHARVVADDVTVADVFAKTCRAGIDKKTGVEHKCISDEVSASAGC